MPPACSSRIDHGNIEPLLQILFYLWQTFTFYMDHVSIFNRGNFDILYMTMSE